MIELPGGQKDLSEEVIFAYCINTIVTTATGVSLYDLNQNIFSFLPTVGSMLGPFIKSGIKKAAKTASKS